MAKKDETVDVIVAKEFTYMGIILARGTRTTVPKHTAQKLETRGLARSVKIQLPIG